MEDTNTAQAESHLSCTHCNYDLTGLDLTGSCPECGNKIITTCFNCDYNLAGLDPSGVCPECGFTIEGSIGRGELAKANPGYLAKLHKGVFIIQAAIIVQILMVFASIGVGVAVGMSGGQSTAFEIVTGLIFLAIALITIYGWWLFTETDPDYSGNYTGSEARKLVRIMILIGAGFTLIQTVLNFIPVSNTISIVIGVLALIALVVSVIQFFAQMFYIKWMAPLIRNKKVYNRSKLLMWLGPVLMTFGILLIGLGPLIALVLYWNMLDWIRKDLKAIRENHHAIA
jgi:predicted RNA-binding Zn-ribbon protein involved in translation (DUF1610 family)